MRSKRNNIHTCIGSAYVALSLTRVCVRERENLYLSYLAVVLARTIDIQEIKEYISSCKRKKKERRRVLDRIDRLGGNKQLKIPFNLSFASY